MQNGSSGRPTATGRTFLWLILRYARRHAGTVALVAGLTLVGNLLAVLQPAILAGLLASLSLTPTQTIPASGSWLDLNSLGVRVTGLFFGTGASGNTVVVFFGLLFLLQSTLVAGATYLADYGAVWLRTRYAKLIQRGLLSHVLHQDMGAGSAFIAVMVTTMYVPSLALRLVLPLTVDWQSTWCPQLTF